VPWKFAAYDFGVPMLEYVIIQWLLGV
jgi:hypothetical protein